MMEEGSVGLVIIVIEISGSGSGECTDCSPFVYAMFIYYNKIR